MSFREVLFKGLAPDGGLYIPTSIPILDEKEINEMKGLPYSEVAFRILKEFLAGTLSEDSLEAVCSRAYNFPVPIEKLDNETSVLFLDCGPTASFKDFSARFMAQTMQELKEADDLVTILVATSGDTGSAVGEAFRAADGFRVFILYPREEVSDIQQDQLERIGGNVSTLSIDGHFDDCQKLVKKAFLDPELAPLSLTSSNSINIGRILPQIVYYIYAYVNEDRDGEPSVFSVPSGNFGNSLGCELARRMGLPVDRIIIAVNDNDEFPKFLTSGDYMPLLPSKQCLSNAMNVGNPSNLARYFDLYDGHLLASGKVLKMPNLSAMRENIWSASISDKETKLTIERTFSEHGTVLDPHGAVGLAALKTFREEGNECHTILLETAHPGKFPGTVSDAVGEKVELPQSLIETMARPKRVDKLTSRYKDFQLYLLEQS